MADPRSTTDIQNDYMLRKQKFEKAFAEFHQKVFQSKVLDSNKSSAVKNTELQLLDTLINSSIALNAINDGEGLLGLITICIRELLQTKDRVNELEYMLLNSVKSVKKLQTELGIKDDNKKRP